MEMKSVEQLCLDHQMTVAQQCQSAIRRSHIVSDPDIDRSHRHSLSSSTRPCKPRDAHSYCRACPLLDPARHRFGHIAAHRPVLLEQLS